MSALFRAFGGEGAPARGEVRIAAPGPCMHEAERWVLSVWIPLSVWVAVADWLAPRCGPVWGWLLALPGTMVVLHVLPFILAAGRPAWQWRLWLSAALVWAWWHREAGGIAGVFAWIWLSAGALNLTACLWLVFLRTMRWRGIAGNSWRMFLFLTAHAAAVAAGLRWGWPWALLSGSAIAASCALAIFRPGGQWLGPVRRNTGGNTPLVTIDDGPDPHDTPILLDLLDEAKVKAVFFMIGEKAAAFPELAREVVRRGHEIGNHTMTHPQASFWCAGPWRTWREISRCQMAIEQTTGVKPRWFRSPVGHRNLFTHPACGALGLEVVAWSRRGYDAVGRDPATVLRRIGTGFGPGEIILIHEATPIAGEVLKGLLERLTDRLD